MPRNKKHGRGTLSFAAQLKRLRGNNALSLQGLSSKAGVSKSMISKIERGDVQPSLDIAVRLAEALRTTLSDMVRHDEYGRVIKIERKDQSVVRDPKRKWERRLLSPIFNGVSLEVLHATVGPDIKMGTFPKHPPGTEEYIVVLSGRLEISINGAPYSLETGDSFYFEADKTHSLKNPGDQPAEYLIIIKH